ncbi:MAG: BTAD domain-containing putative transcriptional regulator [Candidatus Cybelea sp.]
MNSKLPRLGPSIVRRAQLEEWLARFKSVPVRFLVAPPGFGKTMAILGYLQHCSPNGRYCVVAAGSNAEAVWNTIARVLDQDLELRSHEDVVAALAARAPMELAMDCAAVPDSSGADAIVALIEDLPENVSLLIACRSRAAFQVGRLVAQGTASLCDAERLAFDAAGIRHLAETLEVSHSHADVLRMLEVTDGWPHVVSSALRKAAEDNCGLAQAFENWRLRHGHLFNEFISDAVKHVSEKDSNLVFKLMSGSYLDDRQQLQALEEQGLFVTHTPDGYRPLRALSRSRVYDRYGRRVQAVTPMQVRLFGWFRAEVDRQPIEWIRRRDRQLFKYLALHPSGSVSRTELGQVFWPDAEKHLVAQSLRTACSNIRKAIAQIVGFDRVDSYFRAGDELALDLENVIVDVNGFVAHVNDGDEQYARGEGRVAHAHYRSAGRLYRGNLLIGDAHEPWVATLSAILEHRHVMILERLSEIAAEMDYQQTAEADLPIASGS